MIIQDAINALPSAGGKITIPAGDFSDQPPLVLNRNNVILEGEGWATVLPRVSGGLDVRREQLILRDLSVNGGKGYAIDFRNVSCVQINDVLATNCTYGLLLDYEAYYALVTSLFVTATTCAVECYGGGNQNTFIGGKWDAPLGLNVAGSNGITIVGTAIEGPSVVNFEQGIDPANSIRFVNVRHEKTNFGPVWLNQ